MHCKRNSFVEPCLYSLIPNKRRAFYNAMWCVIAALLGQDNGGDLYVFPDTLITLFPPGLSVLLGRLADYPIPAAASADHRLRNRILQRRCGDVRRPATRWTPFSSWPVY